MMYDTFVPMRRRKRLVLREIHRNVCAIVYSRPGLDVYGIFVNLFGEDPENKELNFLSVMSSTWNLAGRGGITYGSGFFHPNDKTLRIAAGELTRV